MRLPLIREAGFLSARACEPWAAGPWARKPWRNRISLLTPWLRGGAIIPGRRKMAPAGGGRWGNYWGRLPLAATRFGADRCDTRRGSPVQTGRRHSLSHSASGEGGLSRTRLDCATPRIALAEERDPSQKRGASTGRKGARPSGIPCVTHKAPFCRSALFPPVRNRERGPWRGILKASGRPARDSRRGWPDARCDEAAIPENRHSPISAMNAQNNYSPRLA